MCARKDLNRNGALNDFDFVSEQSEKGSVELRLQDASNLSLRKTEEEKFKSTLCYRNIYDSINLSEGGYLDLNGRRNYRKANRQNTVENMKKLYHTSL